MMYFGEFGWNSRSVLIALLAVLCFYQFDRIRLFLEDMQWGLQPMRTFTKEELSAFTGENDSPIYVAILGEVYDVSSKRAAYGPNGHYRFFAGGDGTLSYITGKPNELTDEEQEKKIRSLNGKEFLEINKWVKFYQNHKNYRKRGILTGLFHEQVSGKPTDLLIYIQAAIKKANMIMEDIQKEEKGKKTPERCNMHWKQAEGGHVWCTEEGKFPRIHKSTNRCLCISVEEMIQAGKWSFKSYEGCDRISQKCPLPA